MRGDFTGTPVVFELSDAEQSAQRSDAGYTKVVRRSPLQGSADRNRTLLRSFSQSYIGGTAPALSPGRLGLSGPCG